MNRPDSTEMDRLLRRFARRDDETPRVSHEQQGDGQDARNNTHLDADELNAYAEGALPEGARSRYFAHLADCDTCRKLVTDLTLAATVAHEQKAHVAYPAASPSKSWRDWLAALLSPPVLRYGVPALALFAIIVVAIVATRTRRRDASFVAEQNEAARTYAPSAASNSNSTAESVPTDTTVENHSNSNSTASNTASTVRQQNPASQTGIDGSPVQEPNGKIVADAPTVAQPSVAKSAEEQRGGNAKQPVPGESGKLMDETVTVTAAPPPVPTPVLSSSTTATEAENKDKREDRKRAQAAENDDQIKVNTNAVGGAAAPLSINGASRDTSGRRTSRTVQNLPTTKPASPPKSEASDVAAEKERSPETRNIKGRKFRKQGSAWVDTAYNSSLSTTNVSRGSEQYRALVADEPELRAITQQLGGVVIVVWKGRAYRFY